MDNNLIDRAPTFPLLSPFLNPLKGKMSRPTIICSRHRHLIAAAWCSSRHQWNVSHLIPLRSLDQQIVHTMLFLYLPDTVQGNWTVTGQYELAISPRVPVRMTTALNPLTSICWAFFAFNHNVGLLCNKSKFFCFFCSFISSVFLQEFSPALHPCGFGAVELGPCTPSARRMA